MTSKRFSHIKPGPLRWRFTSILVTMILSVLCSNGQPVQAQTFNSESDGSDGALNLTTPGTIVFDPSTFNPPLDADGDSIYHFTTITIAEDVTVRLSAANLKRPVFWLATGAVQIDGTIDLNGEDGQTEKTLSTMAPDDPLWRVQGALEAAFLGHSQHLRRQEMVLAEVRFFLAAAATLLVYRTPSTPTAMRFWYRCKVVLEAQEEHTQAVVTVVVVEQGPGLC